VPKQDVEVGLPSPALYPQLVINRYARTIRALIHSHDTRSANKIAPAK
jgi:hypothetical protein